MIQVLKNIVSYFTTCPRHRVSEALSLVVLSVCLITGSVPQATRWVRIERTLVSIL